MAFHIMTYALPIAPRYRRPIFEALALQSAVVLLSGLALDFGQARQICGFALLAFWGGALVLILRRRLDPTPLDLSLLRIGYLLVLILTAFFAPVIWHLRGLM